MAKTKTSKISKVKRDNQKRTKLMKQGKLKLQRHKKKQNVVQKQNVKKPEEIVEDESDQGEDLLDMVEKEDLDFLESSLKSQSYNIYKKLRWTESEAVKPRRNKKKSENSALEDKYEELVEKIAEESSSKKVKMLLPVKTQDGTVKKRIIEENIIENDEDFQENGRDIDDDMEVDMDSDTEALIDFEPAHEPQDTEKISTVELLACREEVLRAKKFKIGLLSSSVLENPQLKINNLKALLDLMDEVNPEVYITVKKLATISLLEVFKDLLPSYNIHEKTQDGVRFKKDVLQLQNYEAALLRHYKSYLQKLEKFGGRLRKKKGDTRIFSDVEINLAVLAVTTMCDLLMTNPYFNFSMNIANFLVPLLDNKRPVVRETILKCFSQIFKEDKRGELSLTIVRKLNQYIKLHGHSVHSEVVSVLLALRIKDVNLDKEREEDAKQRKLMSHKQRVLALSKRERKKDKKLQEIEKEMLEASAQENQINKQKTLTEIISIVFTIYFRILKQAPNSKILSVCLEGLAKFAHCINLDFYQDLVNVINKLMEEGNLGQRQQLHCIQTVFTILSGQGSALNIDPYRFYVHLYKILLNVHMGKSQEDCEIIVNCLVQVLINRRKRITQNRLVAFVKRVSTLTLQLQHHGALGLLGVIKSIFQLSKSANILLDTDNNAGDGFYQPELDEPEYCNAHCSALWELVALQRHYHSVVQKVAKNIAAGVPTTGEGSLAPEFAKLSPEKLYNEFNPYGVVFNPAVPVPKKTVAKNLALKRGFVSGEFESYISDVKKRPAANRTFMDFHLDVIKNF